MHTVCAAQIEMVDVLGSLGKVHNEHCVELFLPVWSSRVGRWHAVYAAQIERVDALGSLVQVRNEHCVEIFCPYRVEWRQCARKERELMHTAKFRLGALDLGRKDAWNRWI